MATSFDSTLAGLGIARTGAATAAKDSANLGNSNMDQGDFLTLMTAQLKNQDPFEPVDNSQMVAQMAQFSSLSGITEMSTTLKAIASKLGRIPTVAEYHEAMGIVNKDAATIYQYLNFDRIEEYVEGANAVTV